MVVATPWGRLPRRAPMRRFDQAASARDTDLAVISSFCEAHQAASSSAQNFSHCGPRNWPGSSAEKQVAWAPLGQVRRRLLGSHVGRSSSGEQARMPDSPSTMTSR